MKENITASSFITKYEDIHRNLQEITTTYLSKEENLKDFILEQREKNKSGFTNSLIEIPETDIKYTLKKEYISNANNISGELGVISPEDQTHEIKNMALLTLMSNRLSKYYKYEVENNKSLDDKTKEQYTKEKRRLLLSKDNATSDLIASLYVLEKTGGKKYSNLFSYGNRKYDNQKDTFTIDLPYVGQISVHFGNKKEFILQDAKNKAISILERKKELGQIKENNFNKIIEQLDTNGILPDYTGKLFEYVSALPIEYIGPHTKEKINKLSLDNKNPKQIKTEDIERIYRSGLNVREAYYLAIKLGFPKSKLIEVLNVYNEKDISKGALKMTNANERARVKEAERKNISRYREIKDTNVIGG